MKYVFFFAQKYDTNFLVFLKSQFIFVLSKLINSTLSRAEKGHQNGLVITKSVGSRSAIISVAYGMRTRSSKVCFFIRVFDGLFCENSVCSLLSMFSLSRM